MFVNISNHPSAKWSPEQRQDAEALGGPIVDVAFPNVPPDAPASEVGVLMGSIILALSRLPERVQGVMVQGEFTLTYAIVRELSRQRIPCYAATTSRVATEVINPDGSVTRGHEFKFVQFRQY